MSLQIRQKQQVNLDGNIRNKLIYSSYEKSYEIK